MSMRLVDAPLEIELSIYNDQEALQREFQRLSGVDDDAIGQFVRRAKARGETHETDNVLLQLLVELHRKVDRLEKLYKHEEEKLEALNIQAAITAIGYEHIQLKEPVLKADTTYYARIMMPVYPQRLVPLFVKAIDENHAKILQMHENDITDYNAYVAARERIMIRQMKGL